MGASATVPRLPTWGQGHLCTCVPGRGRPARCTGGRRWSVLAVPRSPTSPWTRGRGRSSQRALCKHTYKHNVRLTLLNDCSASLVPPPRTAARASGFPHLCHLCFHPTTCVVPKPITCARGRARLARHKRVRCRRLPP